MRRRNDAVAACVLALPLAAVVMVAACSQPAAPVMPAAAGAAPAALPLPALLTSERAAQRRLYNPAGLDRFFAALARLDRRRTGPPVRILQIGDSHSANDGFAGRMREALQARFGAAGRGWLPIGMPFAYFRPRLVTVEETGWRHLAGPAAARAWPLGLDAAVAESAAGGASMRLTSDEPAGFDRAALEILAAPGGGELSVEVDRRRPVTIATGAARAEARRIEIPAGPHSRELRLQATGRRPVRLLGWAIERRRAGVVYENHGTIGARITLVEAMDPATLARELGDSRPALLVVAFGTNEGFDDALDLASYRARFGAAVERLQRWAPQASVLILGPPDGSRLDPACQPGQGAAADCAAGAAAPAGACEWRSPPNLGPVRDLQERVAADRGWGFWNWSQAMGGSCSIHRLLAHDPPWAFPDHVHLTRLGYQAAADVLVYDLFDAYRDWRRRHAPARAVRR